MTIIINSYDISFSKMQVKTLENADYKSSAEGDYKLHNET